MRKYLSKSSILFCLCFVMSGFLFAQTTPFKNQRAEEDYSYLKDSFDLKGWEAIKYIALNKQRSNYLSIGGSIRPRYEVLINRFWIPDNDLNYYSQRTAFYTDLHFGKNFRFFGELQSGLVTAGNNLQNSLDYNISEQGRERRFQLLEITIL